MNLPLFIAKRIYHEDGHQQEVSRPAIRIATAGVAIGLAVMTVTVAVVLGFKHTIRDKVVGFGSHIRIENFMASQATFPIPIAPSDSLKQALNKLPGISHQANYTMVQGILKTDSDFLGLAFKGLGKDYDVTFLQQHLVEGSLPNFGKEQGYPLLISRLTANQLQLKCGDRITAYFIGNNDVRVRRFTVKGIYDTNMVHFDEALCFTNYDIPQKLNGWADDQCSGIELCVTDFDQIEETAKEVADLIGRQSDKYDETMVSETIQEAHPNIFSWLSLLDVNVWIILVLMVCVAGFTMISGMLIIILERTQMIGTMKALGARNSTVRKTFLWFATFILLRGMLVGNILALTLIVLQQQMGFIRLDPSSYYVETAPMELDFLAFAALNVATLAVSVLVLLAPSLLVAHIHPARSMRYE